MPILNSEIRSYNIIFTGKKERLIQSLQENNLTQYIFLNDLLMVLYVEANFNENIFNNINTPGSYKLPRASRSGSHPHQQ